MMKFVIAGGGTGGHIFPGIAVAQGLARINSKYEILFIGTDTGIEKETVTRYGFLFKNIKISGINSKNYMEILKALLRLPIAIIYSAVILKRFKPNFVLGVGGYVSGPVLLAAWILGIPRAICEQNSIPGFTNHILGKYFVSTVWGMFENCKKFFPAGRYETTGNPLRIEFSNYVTNQEPKNSILILGGSRGARPLNAIIPISMKLIIEKIPNLTITHQTGSVDFEMVKSQYSSFKIDANVFAFIEDMISAYSGTSLVIARSGAGVCSELIATNVPSILIPFPQSTNNHQVMNAKELVNFGIAITLSQESLSPKFLSDTIKNLLLNSNTLRSMKINASNICHTYKGSANVIAHKIIESCIN